METGQKSCSFMASVERQLRTIQRSCTFSPSPCTTCIIFEFYDYTYIVILIIHSFFLLSFLIKHISKQHTYHLRKHTHTLIYNIMFPFKVFFFFLFSREGEVKCLVMMGSIDEMALTSLVKVNALSSNSKVTKLVIKTNIG